MPFNDDDFEANRNHLATALHASDAENLLRERKNNNCMSNELKTNITEINRLTCSLDELKNQIYIAKQSENSLIEQYENLCRESSAENNDANLAII